MISLLINQHPPGSTVHHFGDSNVHCLGDKIHYIILLLVVSTPVYIIAIDNVVLVTNMIILIIHIFAAIKISKITSFVLALGL
jgi:hypothetical protein